ncbi:flagellar basal-body rod protein FlgB [Janthinobacterium sp. Marseille]|jgi:flagellar basal-body rod protein FlgB|uniref:Flagellar basal body rod protein FlgB n=1 Tax=Herminiimonas contaminans TaxID=1111140 RepID=A0ABS0EYL4_9BURK|nr:MULTISPECIES: flagellar basal body rod protein FlgB [Oxalobacteraceae]ABR91587.1 flagellar basal-body rod protein FlgB [Janthinobacterium sp. Marseille]MBF8179718.1 flagellar basal body rod protein FlgB [Herminiimonas contaminans]
MDNVTNKGHIPIGNQSSDDRFWETSVRLFSKRLEVVASNIANADTPNYKARDIDFKTALNRALAAPDKIVPKGTLPQSSAVNDVLPKLLYRTPYQQSVDGNTVELDTERAVFTTTAIRYEFAMEQAVSTYKELSDLFKNLT